MSCALATLDIRLSLWEQLGVVQEPNPCIIHIICNITLQHMSETILHLSLFINTKLSNPWINCTESIVQIKTCNNDFHFVVWLFCLNSQLELLVTLGSSTIPEHHNFHA